MITYGDAFTLLGLGARFAEKAAEWIDLDDEVPAEKLAALAAKTDAAVDRAHGLKGGEE